MKRKILGVLLLLTSFGLIGYGVYLNKYNPKRVMLDYLSSAFNSGYRSLSNNLSNESKTKVKSTGTIKLGNSANVNYDSDYYLDSSKKIFYLKMLFKLDDKNSSNSDNSFNQEIYFENNKLYFKDMTDNKVKYIDLSGTDNSLTKKEDNVTVSKDTLNELKAVIGRQIYDKIPDEQFSKEKSSTKVLTNSISADKYSVLLKNKDIYNVAEGIVTEIYNNSKLTGLKEKLFSSRDLATVKKDLKSAIIGSDIEEGEAGTFSVYTSNKKIVKIEAILGSDTLIFGNYEKTKGIYDIELFAGNKDSSVSLNLEGSSDGYKVAYTSDDFYVEGTVKAEGKNTDLDLKMYADKDKKETVGSINYSSKEVKENSEYSSKFKLEIKQKMGNISVDLTNKIYLNQEAPKYDTSKATEYKNISKSLIENKNLKKI